MCVCVCVSKLTWHAAIHCVDYPAGMAVNHKEFLHRPGTMFNLIQNFSNAVGNFAKKL